MQHDQRQAWLERPGSVNKIIIALMGLCVFFGLLDLVIGRASHFDFEAYPGFYSLFGFIACVGLVLVAKLLRKILMRPEDYYD